MRITETIVACGWVHTILAMMFLFVTTCYGTLGLCCLLNTTHLRRRYPEARIWPLDHALRLS